MPSEVNYRIGNEYDDLVGNIRDYNYSKSNPRIKNENYKDIQTLKIKINLSIIFFSIVILINIFLLGYIAKGLIFYSNNQNGNIYLYIKL